MLASWVKGGSESFSNQAGQADNFLKWAFGEIIVMTPHAGLNSTSGHMWPWGLIFPTSFREEAYNC